MQRIQEIIARRSDDGYFQDCTYGHDLQDVHDKEFEKAYSLLGYKDAQYVWQLIREMVPERRYRHLLRKMRGRELSRSLLVEIAAELLAQQAVDDRARLRGCAAHSGCIHCPHGQIIVAKEIYAYAMGGA